MGGAADNGKEWEELLITARNLHILHMAIE
jgi:hypothetical protein